MAKKAVYQVDFQSSEGLRIEFNEEGCNILNIRQLGEGQRKDALALLARMEDYIEHSLANAAEPLALTERAERMATKFSLRITHRRAKTLDSYRR
jgi:hypothetical protein